MSNVAVLTDSCASIPENILASLQIHTVAFYIHRGQEVLRDLVTIQREEFLCWLASARFLPTTASPGPGDYFEAYKQLANQGKREIISLQMSSKISGGFQAACVAQTMMRDEFPEVRIEVIDTMNVALCQGWMVIEIMEGLRGHTSGYAVPQYIVDAPGGGGKIPVMPNYLLSMSDHKVILRNYEGFVTTYEEPTDYLPSDAAKFKGDQRPEPGQSGVAGLLAGEQMFIKPEGFDETHDRHGIQHRLKDEKKWQPLGIGSGASHEETRTVSETAPDGQASEVSNAKE